MHDNNFCNIMATFQKRRIRSKVGWAPRRWARQSTSNRLMETLASNQLSCSVWKPLGVALSGSTSALWYSKIRNLRLGMSIIAVNDLHRVTGSQVVPGLDNYYSSVNLTRIRDTDWGKIRREWTHCKNASGWKLGSYQKLFGILFFLYYRKVGNWARFL
jgi:hypothetical protein